MIAPPEPPNSAPPRASTPRISQEFYASPPAYSEPPLPSLPAAPPAPKPTRKRRVLSALLFVAVFLPAAALLAKVVVNKYDARIDASSAHESQ